MFGRVYQRIINRQERINIYAETRNKTLQNDIGVSHLSLEKFILPLKRVQQVEINIIKIGWLEEIQISRST